MGMNVGKPTSTSYSRIYLDYVRRTFAPFVVPGTSTPVALDASGNPTASYEVSLGNPLANDLMTYTLWVQGGTFTSAQKSSSTTTTVVNFGSPTSDGSGNTYCTMTVVSGGGNLGVVINSPSAGAKAVAILPPGYTLANVNDFHPDAITQMGLGTTIRSLDWVNPNNSTDSNWAGSLAAGGDGSVRGKVQSLSEFCRFANACSANVWTNIPALATDAYISSFVSTADASTNAGSIINLEFSNETWNNQFAAYAQLTQAACTLATTYTGSTSTPSTKINSCSRDGAGTATAVITGAPKNGNGSLVYVSGITNITGGLVTLTAVVNNGDGTYSISWAEAGAAVTGTITTSGNNFTSYIHTDVQPGAVHYLVKGLSTYGKQGGSFAYATPYVMKGRYVVERLRAAWTAVQSLPGKARWRFMLNNAVNQSYGNGLSEYEAYPYAYERFGDHSWIYSIATAPYISSETACQAATSVTDVLNALNHTGGLALDAYVASGLLYDCNASAAWGHVKTFYEGGPANTVMGSAGTYIGAAHRDPGMGTLITNLYTAMRDFGQTGAFCYYQGGAVATFGSGNNTCWASAENGSPGDLTTAKHAAIKAFGAASSQAAPRDGQTSGTILIPNVWSQSTGSLPANNCVLAGTSFVWGPCGVQVMKTVAGNYPISVYASSASSSDWVSIWINGVQVANQIPLTLQNPQAAEPSTPVWSSASYPMNAGRNVVLIQIQPTGRAGVSGYNKVISPDTPV